MSPSKTIYLLRYSNSDNTLSLIHTLAVESSSALSIASLRQDFASETSVTMPDPLELDFTFAVSARATCSACKYKSESKEGKAGAIALGEPRVGLTKWSTTGTRAEWYHPRLECLLPALGDLKRNQKGAKIKAKSLKCKVCDEKKDRPIIGFGNMNAYSVCLSCLTAKITAAKSAHLSPTIAKKVKEAITLGGFDDGQAFDLDLTGLEDVAGWDDCTESEQERIRIAFLGGVDDKNSAPIKGEKRKRENKEDDDTDDAEADDSDTDDADSIDLAPEV